MVFLLTSVPPRISLLYNPEKLIPVVVNEGWYPTKKMEWIRFDYPVFNVGSVCGFILLHFLFKIISFTLVRCPDFYTQNKDKYVLCVLSV